MSWKFYRLIYEAKSPVHVGSYALGFIQRTRYYIPGRPLWGAITANLTRSYFLSGKEENKNIYDIFQKVGREVNKHIRLSYFYPALEPENPLLPLYNERDIKYGNDLSVDKFEHDFIRSNGQTAVEPLTVTAEEASLHEMEFISSSVKQDGKFLPVLFIGYIIVNEGETIDGKNLGWQHSEVNLKEVMQELFIGGERKYGFGHLVLNTSCEYQADWRLFNHKVTIESRNGNDEPLLEIDENISVPAHLLVTENTLNLKGDIESLAGKEWQEKATSDGKLLYASPITTKPQLCWVPGSVLTKRSQFEIDDYGLLK